MLVYYIILMLQFSTDIDNAIHKANHPVSRVRILENPMSLVKYPTN